MDTYYSFSIQGTQTKRLIQKFDIITISSGDLLRKSIMEETPLGLEAQSIIEQGGLVPDNLVIELILSELDKLKGKVCWSSHLLLHLRI